MKQSIRRRLAPLLAVVITTASGMTLAAAGTAQANTASPLDHEITNQQSTTYQIQNRRNSECLTAPSWREAQQIITRGCEDPRFQPAQRQWSFIPVRWENNQLYYMIVSAYNDMCLDVLHAEEANWAIVAQWTGPCIGGDNQLWRVERRPSSWQQLTVKHTGKCLDISWGAAIQFTCEHRSENQDFWIRSSTAMSR